MTYGIIATDTIQSSTTGTPPQFNDGSGTQIGTLCRAWVSFSGSATPTINASFNVSSITYTSTGTFTVNFANALADNKYAFATSAGNVNSTLYGCYQYGSTLSTTGISINTSTFAGVSANVTNNCVSIFR